MPSELPNKSKRFRVLGLMLALYAVSVALALTCLIWTTALTMTAFFVIGLGALGLGFLVYAKLVWDDLHAHGVL
jgi:hypothetical protein